MPSMRDLQAMLDAEPNDAFLRYALAMELAKQGQHAASLGQFDELLRRHATYVPGYFMKGRTLEQAGEPERAKAVYRQGIEVARQTGDLHAAGEMTAALEALG